MKVRKSWLLWGAVAVWAGANIIAIYYLYLREPTPLHEQNAQEILDEAVAEAQDDSKNVLLHVSGPD